MTPKYKPGEVFMVHMDKGVLRILNVYRDTKNRILYETRQGLFSEDQIDEMLKLRQVDW